MNRRFIITSCIVLAIILAVCGVLLTSNNKPSVAQSEPRPLVSLGDSVAAGDGLPEDSGSVASLCHQSVEAYPHLVASNLTMQLHQFACSGAQVSAGILQAQTVGTQSVAPQLDAATPYLPGSDVVITIGANDVDWDNFLITCAQSDCQTPANLTLFQTRLANLQTELNTMLSDIASHHPHTVLLNTYYSIINNSDTCLQQFNINPTSIAWVNAREADLNTTIVAAAEQHHDLYATNTFAGHGLCSSDSWVQGLSGAAPLHPTYEGQFSIATTDETVLR